MTCNGPVKTCPDDGSRQCGNLNDVCYDIIGMTSLCFTETQTQIGNTILNVMSYLLVNFFGIALMWMTVFAVLTRTSPITDGVM